MLQFTKLVMWHFDISFVSHKQNALTYTTNVTNVKINISSPTNGSIKQPNLQSNFYNQDEGENFRNGFHVSVPPAGQQQQQQQ